MVTAGLYASTVRADIIAGDAFNYIPIGASLDKANGGSPSTPGWYAPYNNMYGPVTVATGLEYTSGGIAIGFGKSALVGDASSSATLSRGIAAHTMPTDYWIRALYSPGANDMAGETTVTPFSFQGITGGSFSVSRSPTAPGDPSSMFLNIEPVLTTIEGDPPTSSQQAFSLDAGTHMLLWHVQINPAEGVEDELQMWLDPTSTLEPASINMEGDIFGYSGLDSDFLSNFTSFGAGDNIDELVIGRIFAEGIGPQTMTPLQQFQRFPRR